MKTRCLGVFLFTLCSFSLIACSDDNEIVFEDLTSNEPLEQVHPNDREQPYPHEGNELFINPAPLIVPRTLRGEKDFLEFELSQDRSFPEKGTYRSDKLNWNLYNVHERLASGDWYWRFRIVDEKEEIGVWSEIYHFTVTGKEPIFITPKFKELKKNIPSGHPRISCFLDANIARVCPISSEHREYKDLIDRTKKFSLDVTLPANPHSTSMETLANNTRNYLYTAYRLTGDKKYYDKILEFGRALIEYGITDQQLKDYANFEAGGIVDVVSLCYDVCQNDLTGAEKTKAEEIILKIVEYYYYSFTGRIENHIFDNHTWQIVLRNMIQGALVVCEKYPQAMSQLEYFYELWTGRAPASGFNRSGAWQNGMYYFGTNSYSLYYIPMLFSYLTGTDFLQHPWYRNAGKAISYTWLPNSGCTSFGDGLDNLKETNGRQQVGFMDFLAREVGDPYAAWYAKECETLLHTDLDFRLYRIAKGDASYNTDLNEGDFDNFIWYKDIGEGVAHSNMLDINSNMSLSFRSSQFGSGSHTLADQNSFKLFYKGRPVYTNAGYYQNFSDAHNLLQYRNTRGHNTIMINNIGQPFTTKAYGNLCRGLNGDNLAYFLGDASHAYCGTSDYWQGSFDAAGITQTPEYGFGDNPLNKYKRHIFLLRPNKVVIYDDLGADEPATWQWLLHSAEEFHVSGNVATTMYSTDRGNFTSTAWIYSDQTPTFSVTDEWFPGGEPADQDPTKYPKQWHLTADFASCRENKILTIIQVTDNGSVEKVWKVNNRFIVGDWNIDAEMDENKPASIRITNAKTNTVFGYGDVELTIDGSVYQQRQPGSSVLYDSVHGTTQLQEMTDEPIQITRSVK